MVEREALEKLCVSNHTGGSNPSLSVLEMKNFEIDKTHWIIQFSVLALSFFVFLFLPKIVDLETLFSQKLSSTLHFFPSFLLIFSSLLAVFLRKGVKPFSKSWIFNDFTYWNIFALLLSFVAVYHLSTNSMIYGIFTQIFAYIALLLGYANNLRNEIIKEEVKRKK